MRLGRHLLAMDLYAVLDVEPHASALEIRRAYRRLVTASHPDLNRRDPKANQRMAELNVAAGVLLDDGRRAAYDAQRRVRRRGTTVAAVEAEGWWAAPATGPMEWIRPAAEVPGDGGLTLEELKQLIQRIRTLPGRAFHYVHGRVNQLSAAEWAVLTVLAVLVSAALIAGSHPTTPASPLSADGPVVLGGG